MTQRAASTDETVPVRSGVPKPQFISILIKISILNPHTGAQMHIYTIHYTYIYKHASKHQRAYIFPNKFHFVDRAYSSSTGVVMTSHNAYERCCCCMWLRKDMRHKFASTSYINCCSLVHVHSKPAIEYVYVLFTRVCLCAAYVSISASASFACVVYVYLRCAGKLRAVSLRARVRDAAAGRGAQKLATV